MALYAYGAYDALTAVGGLVVFLEEVFESLGYGFAVGGEVGASVPGVLAIDKRSNIFAVRIAVAENYLDVFSFEVDRRIERFLAEVFVDQVEQSVL